MRSAFLVSVLLGFAGLAHAQSPADDPATDDLPAASRIEAGVGMQFVSRHLRYHDDPYGFLNPYDLPAGPALAMRARVYPFGFGSLRVGPILGVEVKFERSLGVESEQGGNVRFPTIHQIFEMNLVGRARVRRHELVGLLGYGNHAFVLETEAPASPATPATRQTPNVRYSYLRLGGEARIDAHPNVQLIAGASFLLVFDAGGIASEDWFPQARANGVTLDFRLAIPLARGFELQAGVEYRRYFFDLRPKVGDARIAGGALDQYAIAQVVGLYRY